MQYYEDNLDFQELVQIIKKNNLRDFNPDYFSVENILDITDISRLAEKINKATGFLFALLSKNGEVQISVGWQDICVYFHRMNPESYKCCLESDLIINNLSESQLRAEYKCKNGLWDIAHKIKIFNHHIATMYMGQFFYEEDIIDKEYFIRQSQKYGYNKEEYLEALHKVPVYSREKVDEILDLYYSIINIYIKRSEQKLKTAFKYVLNEQNEVNSLLKSKNYMSLLNILTEGIFEYDRMSGYVYGNRAFFHHVNYKINNGSYFEIQDWQSLVFDDDRILFNSFLEDHLNENEFSFEYRVKLNNQISWYRLKAFVYIRDKELRPMKIIGTQVDVSRYKLQNEYLNGINRNYKNKNDLHISLSSVFQIDSLQAFQDSFAETTGLASVIFDENLYQFTKLSGFQKDLCSCSNLSCIKENIARYIKSESYSKLYIDICSQNYFWYAVCPVFFNDKVIAYWYFGQVLIKEDYDKYLNHESVNRKIPIFEMKKIIEKIKVMDKMEFTNIIIYLNQMIIQITENAINGINQSRYIIEKEKIEQKLQQSKEKYKGLFNSIQHSFAVHKMIYNEQGNPIDYEYIEVNSSFEKLIGLPKEKIIGKTVLELLPETENYWIETYAKVAETMNPISFENFSKELNKTFYVSAFSPRKGEFAVMIQDISENLRLKDLISEAEQQFNLMASQMPGILWELDNELRFVRIMGSRLEELYLKPTKVIGKSLYQFFKTNDEEFEAIKKHKLALAGLPQKYELNFRNTILESMVNPLYDRKNNIKGVIGIAFDITEKKKYEEQYIKDNNLRSLGLLAGGIAHDFNNIVAGILGNASLAKFSFQDKDLAVLLEQIEQGCYRAKDLTKQLLTFSKGGMPILEKTDIRELIMSSTDFTLSGSKVKALYSFCDDCKFLTLDKAQFKQVIYNLVLNSLQAMPKGGTISISTELYENEEDTLDLVTGNYLLIKVSDQGLGIDNSALKLIFDPYYTTKFQGNGLGLSVCYSIVRKHNGKITVYSEKNKGTQINIYLPTDLDRNLLPSKQKEDEISLTTIKKASKVLIVDDEEMIRNILEQILKKLGHEVIFCDRGEAAIKIYNDLYQKNNPPDLLILDLTIPGGINGVDCFKQIKMINREVKAVLTSGYIDSSDVKNLLDIGFFAVLNKPFGFKQVVKIINRALGE